MAESIHILTSCMKRLKPSVLAWGQGWRQGRQAGTGLKTCGTLLLEPAPLQEGGVTWSCPQAGTQSMKMLLQSTLPSHFPFFFFFLVCSPTFKHTIAFIKNKEIRQDIKSCNKAESSTLKEKYQGKLKSKYNKFLF